MVHGGGQYLATGTTLGPHLFRPQTHTLFLNSDFLLIGHLGGDIQSSLFLSGCITVFFLYFPFPH